MALPRKLKNFILFNDGRGYLGEVPEVTLPKLQRKMEDYQGGGMQGPIKLDMGMQGLELQWTAGGYLTDVFAQWGATKHDAVQLRFAGALQGDDGTVSQLEVVVRGRHEEIDSGNAKAADKTELKIKTVLSYYQLRIDGTPIIEIDFVNMVEIVNGVDRLAAVRTALGI
jgi:hypothetical protein